MQATNTHFLVKNRLWFSLLTALGYAVVLTLGNRPRLSPIVFLFWVMLFCLAVFFKNRNYLTALGQYSIWKAIRIPLFCLGGAAMFFVVPGSFLRSLFVAAAVVLVFFFENTISAFSENLLLNEILLSAFGGFLGLGAWSYLYVPQYRFWVSLGVFVFIYLLSRSFFEYTPVDKKLKLVASLSVSLLMAEIFWAVGFLPLHFTALSILLTALYYVCMVTNYNFIFNNLDMKKIKFHLFFAGLCVCLVVLSAQWKPSV